MIEVLFLSFLSSCQIFISGYLFHYFLISKDIKNENNIFELGLYGIIVLCFVALFINFFFSLNRFINDLIFIFPVLVFLIFCFDAKIIRKILILSFFTAIFFTLTISFDNHYIPDSGSYHLPFVSILNESKIIIGLNNLHYRFGHISIMQYISAAFNNHLFKDNGISIPLGLIYCYFIGYLIVEIFYKKNNKILFIFIFIVLTFVFFRMNRYSSLGNDGPAHIIFFYLIIESLKNYNSSHLLKKTTLAATFVFMNKITLLFSFFVPIYFLIKSFKTNLILNRINFFCLFFLSLFLFKNFLTSGCIAFPVEQSCIKNIFWFDEDGNRRSNAKDRRIETEAWTKSWPDQTETQKDHATYISDFGWFKVWKNHHGIVILNKIFPFILFLSAIFLSIIFFEYQHLKKYKFQKYDLNFTNFFLVFICFLGSVLWFLKFPVFRYGYSYLICFFGLAISMSIRNFRIFNKLNEIKKICSILIIILILGVSAKHSLRIFPNLINNTGIEAWPRIYSNDLINKKRDNIPVYKNGKLLFYKNMVNQCYYSQSPCTNLFGSDFDLNDINMKILYGYKVYYFIKN